jgi:hypothetical protein
MASLALSPSGRVRDVARNYLVPMEPTIPTLRVTFPGYEEL